MLKYVYVFFFLYLTLPYSLVGQNWKFVKEKDGVQLYSREETGKGLTFFKGVAEIKESAEKVFALIEDVNHTAWWDSKVSHVKVHFYEKNKRSQYYLVYTMPWPFKNRDLSVDMTTSINQATSEYKITALPLSGVFPEEKDLVRIKDYRQVWTVKPINNRTTHIELEFYVNPVENLPNWLLNLVLIDSPIKSINTIRQLLEKK